MAERTAQPGASESGTADPARPALLRPDPGPLRPRAHLPRRLDRAMGRAYGRFGPSRLMRRILARDPARARAVLGELAAWDFERVIPAHGEPLEDDARRVFARAFAPWLA